MPQYEIRNLSDKKIIIIPAVTPYFLEKGEDWFSENVEYILKARRKIPWWKQNSFFIYEGMEIKPSNFVANLISLGYLRESAALFPGEFSGGGAYWRVFPIGSSSILQIEFLGNRIEKISQYSVIKKNAPSFKIPKEVPDALSRLKIGDYVVHEDHGIGIFRGYTQVGGEEFFVIEYAPPALGRLPDILKVPISLLSKVSPYYGFERPKIHRLGSEIWNITKRKAKEEAINFAKELLTLYAKRHSVKREPWKSYPELEGLIKESFVYEETPDQEKALKEIERDLSLPYPTDRLIVGDVGFGKTEIAIRVSWKAVLNGLQVAILAPTTILADQHYRTFKERLEPLGCRISLLSRIVSPKSIPSILNGIKSGDIDIVIGTHRILSKYVSFKRLGLLIIDEEQRFGVLQKEKLKMLKSSIDTLSLSATPIPRTLYFSLAKLRPMSILKTPPKGRIEIKTFVLPYSQKIIKDAISFEIERNGQVYFLHNRIGTIHARKEELNKILPHSKIEIIHGRMPEQKIVNVMNKFREGQIDVLVATTIIENGLDLSNVNTLIVADSIRLGLAQAHQLRGRIGRGNQQAYAYFLYSPTHIKPQSSQKYSHKIKEDKIQSLAIERLMALKEYSSLGSGFDIAMKDLELRGAGNILGKQQSGIVNSVGINLYMQMLSEIIEKLSLDAT
jgi:transcription-repair coupling factor (superfamily II helicase)